MNRPHRELVIDLNAAEDEGLLANTVERARRDLQRLAIPDIAVNEQIQSREKWVETLFRFARHTRKYAADLCIVGDSQAMFREEQRTGVPTRSYVSGDYTRFLRELLQKHSDSEAEVAQFIGELPDEVFMSHRWNDPAHHRDMMEEGRTIVRHNVEKRSLNAVKQGSHAELVAAVGFRAMQIALGVCTLLRGAPISQYRKFVERALSVRCITAYATWQMWSAASGHNATKDGSKERRTFYDTYYIGYGTLCGGLVSKDGEQQTIAGIIASGFSQLAQQSAAWWETQRETACRAVDRGDGTGPRETS